LTDNKNYCNIILRSGKTGLRQKRKDGVAVKISLKAARVNADLSQRTVAKRLNITQGTLVNWEKGRNDPSAGKLLELCALYGCEVNDLRFS